MPGDCGDRHQSGDRYGDEMGVVPAKNDGDDGDADDQKSADLVKIRRQVPFLLYT